MMDLNNKVAIVTGASAGIGAATVKALLKQGMKVVGFARRKEKIENLVENHDGKLFAVSVDVTKPQEILAGFAWVTKNVGPVHVLINNAGVLGNSTVLTGDLDTWQQLMDTNFMSYAITTKEAVKIMTANNINGYIININSTIGYYDLLMPNNVMYRSSKIALRVMTENVRVELARMNSNIRITSLSPGVVKTDIMAATYGEEMGKEMHSNIPYILSEDIADSILYVLSTPQRVNISEIMIRPTGEDIRKLSV
ncbi:farnesol dehydrogenase-like [Onthophagus taurus]|uniref:farnesol dehydrogenase-like n=1 Tax=Onthophagus taurus TaxID=166361 RepID=UPI000C20DEB5|nr:farnesol dehydrogenase-like [Onthophagus taurus]